MSSWIKMRTDLRTHPKVVRMASALKADRLRIVGGLWAVWGIFDTHSVDGTLEGYTLAALDDDLGWRGFCQAMAGVVWLAESDDGLEIPEFDEHNGSSAKRRATETKRVASNRKADKGAHGSWDEGGQVSASDADKSRTRVRLEKEIEKEIEKEEIPPPTPAVPSVAVAGRVLLVAKFKAEGILPSSTAMLDQFVASGVTWDEIEPLLPAARGSRNALAYIAAAVNGQRERAAKTVIAPKPAAVDTATNPDVAATAQRLAAEAARPIAKPPAELLARRQARHAGEPT